MRVVRNLEDVTRVSDGSVVTIGAYDGVHLGHQRVLHLVRELASARGLEAAVVTFDRHPAQVVRPESAPKLLTSLDQKLELLDATGDVDVCCVLTFDEARSHETAEDFVTEVLVEKLRPRRVVVGEDFHFGHKRGGNVPLLGRMGAELGFEVLGLALVAVEGDGGGTIYSSTRIRELLAEGDVTEAARLLGRPHEVRGIVAEGDRRGRTLGFPTANLTVPAGRSRSDGARRSTTTPTCRCSRRTCSTSTATSTASRPASASSSGCAVSSASTASTRSSSR